MKNKNKNKMCESYRFLSGKEKNQEKNNFIYVDQDY